MWRLARQDGRSDDGSVLIAVLGIMTIISALAIGAFAMSSDNVFQSRRERMSTQALHVAEAGLDSAMWRIRTMGSSVPSSWTVTTPSGTAQVKAVPQGSYQYALVSTGTVAEDPAIHRTISSRVFYVSLWNFVMGAGTFQGGGGGTLHGNTSVDGPFYITGELSAGGNSQFNVGPLFVRDGGISLNSMSAGIGLASAPVDIFCDGIITGGQIYGTVDPNVPQLTLPSPNFEVSYENAKIESLDGLKGTTGQTTTPNNELRGINPPNPTGSLLVGATRYYKVLDDVEGIQGTAPAVRFSTMASFGDAAEGDDFVWDSGTSTLYVYGTVFVDGDVYFDVPIRYVGNGTMVVKGNAYISEILLPQGFTDADRTLAGTVLGITSPGTISVSVAGAGNGSIVVAGAWFAGTRLEFTANNIGFVGSVLAADLAFMDGASTVNNAHLFTDSNLPNYLPPSLPGGNGRVVLSTRWHEGIN